LLIVIPGREDINVKHVILDFNGTIAVDGKLIDGVATKINQLSQIVNFTVVTADTYGTVKSELSGVNCKLVNLGQTDEFKDKLEVLTSLGKDNTLCVGNGFNDRIVLKASILGISVLQDEGLSVEALMASDMVCKSIDDVFCCIENPQRIAASLRL